jgi:hypothetical protein
VQLAPAAMLHPIIKPWLFHGWALDFIGQIHLTSSKGHQFMLVTTDYFTKWMKAVPLKNMTHKEVIHFISEHIVHRFGIPQTLTNGQAKPSNKTLIKKKIEENPKRWHEVLSDALWAHRIFKHSATKVMPFVLVYRQEVILPMEVNLDALRIA